MPTTQKCLHDKGCEVSASFTHLTDPDRYLVEISAVCTQCGTAVRFQDLPAMISTRKPCVNIDAQVVTLPITFEPQGLATNMEVDAG